MRQCVHPPSIKDYVSHCIHQGQSYSGNKVDRDPESDDYFNGKNHEEKNVLGDGKIFKNFVSFLQKTSAYRRGVHPERVIGSGALPRCRTGHFVLLVGWNGWAKTADHLDRPGSQSTKNQLCYMDSCQLVNNIFFPSEGV